MTQSKKIAETLLNVAWLSIILGLSMELLFLALAAGFRNSPTFQVIIADVVQKISWSTFVCVGVAVGTAAAKMRPQLMGLAGLIAAPIAFNLAKIMHKSTTQALQVSASAAAGGPSPILLATIKALEYAFLGLIIGSISRNPKLTLGYYMLVGLLTGCIFGGTAVLLMVTMAAKPLPLFGIVSRAANEIIFPVGCSMVLYAAQKLGEKSK